MNATTPKLTKVDQDAIRNAGADGHAAYAPMVGKATCDKSQRRLADTGLVVLDERPNKFKPGTTLVHGVWLTQEGWVLRRQLRAAEGLPADEIVTRLLRKTTRPAGAVTITYADSVPADRRHIEA